MLTAGRLSRRSYALAAASERTPGAAGAGGGGGWGGGVAGAPCGAGRRVGKYPRPRRRRSRGRLGRRRGRRARLCDGVPVERQNDRNYGNEAGYRHFGTGPFPVGGVIPLQAAMIKSSA